MHMTLGAMFGLSQVKSLKFKLLCHAVDSVVNHFVTGLDGLMKFKWKVVFLIEHCLTLQIGMFRYYLRDVGLH